RGLPADGADCVSERDIFGADFDAVLGVATVAHALGAFHVVQSLALELFARLMKVEVERLADGLCAAEFEVRAELRACFEATTAGHAFGKVVAKVLLRL